MAAVNWTEWKCDFCGATKTTSGAAPSDWTIIGTTSRDICPAHNDEPWGQLLARMF